MSFGVCVFINCVFVMKESIAALCSVEMFNKVCVLSLYYLRSDAKAFGLIGKRHTHPQELLRHSARVTKPLHLNH